MKLFDLSGKKALITGSSQGLGFANAQGLAEAGAEIILNGRTSEKLDLAKHELELQGHKVYTSAFDVTEEKQVVEAVDKIENEIGYIDILVNNAGMIARGPVEDFDSQTWRDVMDLNINAMFYVSKAVGKKMISRKAGRIINIASLLTEAARPNVSPYATSKGAVKLLTRSLAVEWAKYNIQVNAIGPGFFETELNKNIKANSEFDNWVCTRTPMGRWGDPKELVGAAIFLASKASDFMTGQVIYVDGGWLASL